MPSPITRKRDKERFAALLEIVRSRKGRIYPFDKSMLMKYYEWYGPEILESLIPLAMSRSLLDAADWQAIANGYKAHGIEKMEWAFGRLVGLKNHSVDSWIAIAQGSMPAFRKLAKKGEPVQAEDARTAYAATFPTPDGIYTEGKMGTWLREHGKPPASFEEYFDYAGDGKYNWKLYQLKSEYR